MFVFINLWETEKQWCRMINDFGLDLRGYWCKRRHYYYNAFIGHGMAEDRSLLNSWDSDVA